jgi:isochorismate hydrolase
VDHPRKRTGLRDVFGRSDYNGVSRTSEEAHAMSLANLDGEYAQILSTEAVLGISAEHALSR